MRFKYSLTDSNEVMRNAFENLDKLYEEIKDDFKEIKVVFNNFNTYTVERFRYKGEDYSTLCSIREEGCHPVYFFLYIGSDECFHAYIPKANNLIYKEDGRHSISLSDKPKIEYLEKMYGEYRTHVLNIGDLPKKPNCNVTKEDFQSLIDRMGNEKVDYLKYYAEYLDFYNVRMEYIKDITNISDFKTCTSKGKSFLYAMADIVLDNDKLCNLKAILYVTKKGGLKMYVPIHGNAIDVRNGKVFKKASHVYYDEKKMLAEFCRLIGTPISYPVDFSLPLIDLCGIPFEHHNGKQPLLANKANKQVFEKMQKDGFDFEGLFMNCFKKHFPTLECKIKVLDTEFTDVYVKECVAFVNGFYPFKMLAYLDENEDIQAILPWTDNGLYKGQLIKIGTEIPYIDIDRCGIGCLKRIEKDVNTTEIFNGRPYGFAVLRKKGLEGTEYKEGAIECLIQPSDGHTKVIFVDILGNIRDFTVNDVSEIKNHLMVTDTENDEDLFDLV